MIQLRYGMKPVSVNKGLANNWKRSFASDDVRVPDGWDHSIELNGHMVRFAFVNLKGCRTLSDGGYLAIIVCGTRADALGTSGNAWTETTHLIPVMTGLRAIQEDAGPRLSFNDWLEQVSLVSFTKEQLEEWRKAKKIKVN